MIQPSSRPSLQTRPNPANLHLCADFQPSPKMLMNDHPQRRLSFYPLRSDCTHLQLSVPLRTTSLPLTGSKKTLAPNILQSLCRKFRMRLPPRMFICWKTFGDVGPFSPSHWMGEEYRDSRDVRTVLRILLAIRGLYAIRSWMDRDRSPYHQ
ncbi:hypothetical protein JAAARDRAFT_594093 [Jaapia argillacea MUCL 33604]|uniref:Uncharacterized protein n=1 Tax=Jaapia argillacea MUCL 33604 TaxID=933084 RepID=A0A067PYY3_9AGAM|nr:hypothetical protein JAAARDRAFT_594093 [Jaapia argillacea MUCL 33604]